MKTPLMRYRPVRTSDGAGGVVNSFDEGAVIWGALEVHGNEVSVVGVDVREDVAVTDEIEISE